MTVDTGFAVFIGAADPLGKVLRLSTSVGMIRG